MNDCKVNEYCKFNSKCSWQRGSNIDNCCYWLKDPWKYITYDLLHKRQRRICSSLKLELESEERNNERKKRKLLMDLDTVKKELV